MNGNLTAGAGATITWNYATLASVTKGGATTTFTYDAVGGPHRQGRDTYYFGRPIEQKPNGTVVKYYHALRHARREAGERGQAWFHGDHLGRCG